MSEYEQTQVVDVSVDETFAWLSDVSNLHKYLPPVTEAHLEGPSAEGTPGRHVRLKLEFPNGSSFDSEGYLAVDEDARRMEWGAESERDYSGWLTVAGSGGDSSEVTVHLSFGERSVEGDIQEADENRDPLAESIAATLESIRRQIEEGSGKVQPPPPPEGAQPTDN